MEGRLAIVVLTCFRVWGLGPVHSSFRALSGRLKFTVRRHKCNKDSLLTQGQILSQSTVAIDGILSQFPYNCHQNRVASLGFAPGLPPGWLTRQVRPVLEQKPHRLLVPPAGSLMQCRRSILIHKEL